MDNAEFAATCHQLTSLMTKLHREIDEEQDGELTAFQTAWLLPVLLSTKRLFPPDENRDDDSDSDFRVDDTLR